LTIPPDEFRLPFFLENGFVRRQCKVCGSYFWTQSESAEDCGDAPCCEYTFLGKPPTKRSYTVAEMREKFLSFFEAHGHERVRPYPVVARWRDDLLFTIASIVDFQPYVTEGIIPPPANPLVVSQPCLRFEDIDLVGHTAGRHLTIFEMGGHHAFNYKDKPQVYWKDETIRFHHELLTKDLGVPSEMVTYKESFWSGGGNAGPCVEACVSGLEISTLVFMQYRTVGEKLEPMPIRVVDTGYGIERWTWLSQGSPTAFHAVYGSLLDKLLGWADLKRVEPRLIEESTKFSALVQTKGKRATRRLVAERLGMGAEELDRILSPVEAASAVLDHTKALVFILSEGVVPSNVREGYLARLLFRRSYRLLRRLGIADRLPEIIDRQVEYWSNTFPHLEEMHEEILEAIEAEREKYQETLGRGTRLVSKIVENSRAEGRKTIPMEQLIELYDSHGLTPEDVREFSEKEGFETPMPEDFYSLVAKRHSIIEAQAEGKTPGLKEKVIGIPETRKLYYEDPYMKEFYAKVLAVIDGRYLVLDRTAFYSEGGGQPSDMGWLTLNGVKAGVVHVEDVDKVLLHEVEEGCALPEVGATIHGEVDWERRAALMRHHTTTHILIGAARRVIGDHAWQAGAQKGVESSRLDISHWRRLEREEIEEVERLANRVVMEGRKVSTFWMPRNEAEERYGFRLYQGGAVPGKDIRVVEVEGWDVEACGGTHCRSTSEIGFIKILRTERVQDGVERLIFSAGPAALEAVQGRDRMLTEIAENLEVPLDKAVESVQRVLEERDRLRREVESLRRLSSRQRAEELLAEAEEIRGVKLIVRTEDADVDYLIKMGNEIEEMNPSTISVLFAERSGRVVSIVGRGVMELGVQAGELASEAAKVLGGGGGGDRHFGQGGGRDTAKIPEAKDRIYELLRSYLREKQGNKPAMI
jgi:alanyl-tRNA synthetase